MKKTIILMALGFALSAPALAIFETGAVPKCLAQTAVSDANAKDKDGVTSLMRAAEAIDVDQVKSLIQAGANVKAKDKIGKTALMYAAQRGSAACVKALIDAGSDAKAKDKHGKTAMKYADGRASVVEALGGSAAKAGATVASQPKPRDVATDKYRAVSPDDNLDASFRTASLQSHFGIVDGQMVRLDAGEIVDFSFIDKQGNPKKVALKSTLMVDGKVETRDFGTILVRGKSGLFSSTLWMTDTQIKKLKAYLGF